MLVIDDDPQVCEVTQAILERHGFEVVTASGGPEGLSAFHNSPGIFALALVNLSMPKMDGGQVFREFRKIRPEPAGADMQRLFRV